MRSTSEETENCHTARKWQGWNINPGNWSPKTCSLRRGVGVGTDCPHSMLKFPSQGPNPHHNSQLSKSCDNAWFLTCQVTRELPENTLLTWCYLALLRRHSTLQDATGSVFWAVPLVTLCSQCRHGRRLRLTHGRPSPFPSCTFTTVTPAKHGIYCRCYKSPSQWT